MATIYLTDETLEELDQQIAEYNNNNPPTDRSGYVTHLLKQKKKEIKKT